MNEALFMEEIQHWLDDVRAECLRLYTDGVSSERCLGIAINIAEAKAIKRATSRQQIAGGVIRRLPSS